MSAVSRDASAAPSHLEVRALAIRYGAIRAVHDVSLEVRPNEIVTLVGSNGAGKSSTLNAVAGLVRPDAGEIRLAGARVDGRRPWELVARGVSLTPEGRQVFPRFTVEENLAVGAYSRRDRAAVETDLERVFALFPVLRERRRQPAGTLSGGEQQMLAIARALMSRPKLLLLDEPSMGLAPLMVEKIFEVIRAIAAEGVTMLLVEQNARLALETSHRGYVLEGGLVALAGDSKSLLGDPRIREAYLGE